MKVFISWSGERSHAVAKLLNGWIPCVIQEVKTWISSEDIEKGSIWFDDITDTLKETSVGIICLTPENKDKPWILFESGALLSGFTKPRVCPFLIDLTPTDIEPPLSQFNHTVHTKTDMFKLLKSLNNQLSKEHILEEKIIKNVFDKFWPDFDNKYKEILKIKPEKKLIVQAKRDQESIMNEVLMLVRNLNEKEQPHDPTRPGYRRQSIRDDKMSNALNFAVHSIRDSCPHEVIISCIRDMGLSDEEADSIYSNADMFLEQASANKIVI